MKLLYTLTLGFIMLSFLSNENKEQSEIAYNKGLKVCDNQTKLNEIKFSLESLDATTAAFNLLLKQ